MLKVLFYWHELESWGGTGHLGEKRINSWYIHNRKCIWIWGFGNKVNTSEKKKNKTSQIVKGRSYNLKKASQENSKINTKWDRRNEIKSINGYAKCKGPDFSY